LYAHITQYVYYIILNTIDMAVKLKFNKKRHIRRTGDMIVYIGIISFQTEQWSPALTINVTCILQQCYKLIFKHYNNMYDAMMH